MPKPKSYWDYFAEWLKNNSEQELRHGAYGQGWMGSRPLYQPTGRTYPTQGAYGQPWRGWDTTTTPNAGYEPGFAYNYNPRPEQATAPQTMNAPVSTTPASGWNPQGSRFQYLYNPQTPYNRPEGGGGGGWTGAHPTMNDYGQAWGSPGPLQQRFGGPGWSKGGKRVTNKYWTDARIQQRNLSLGKIGAQIKSTGIHGDKNPWRAGQPRADAQGAGGQAKDRNPELQSPQQSYGYWQNALINWRY